MCYLWSFSVPPFAVSSSAMQSRDRIVLAVVVVALALIVLTLCQRRAEIRAVQTATAIATRQTIWTYHLISISKAAELHSMKKGGAFADGDPCADAETLRVTWFYNWSIAPAICPGRESVPMVWGRYAVGLPLGGNSDFILGFNEPDFCDQAALSIDEAIPLWERVENDNPDKRLVSPAMGQGGLNEDPALCGVTGMWLPTFRERFRMATGRYPRFGGIAFHCYALARDWLVDCKRRLAMHTQWAAEWGASDGVWITEFAVVPNAPVPNPLTVTESIQLEAEWIAEMEANQRVAGYAHFTSRRSDTIPGCEWLGGCAKFALFDKAGLSRFGEMYRVK